MYSATVVIHYTCILMTSIFSYVCVSSDLESIVQEESLEENNEQVELSLMAEEDDNKASQTAFMLQTLGNTVPLEL